MLDAIMLVRRWIGMVLAKHSAGMAARFSLLIAPSSN